MKSILALISVLAVSHFFAAPAVAQLSESCYGHYQFFCQDQLLPGTVSCETEGSCLASCKVLNNSCAPPTAPDETCPTCARGVPVAGAPVNLATGNTYIQQTDLSIPGLGGGLSVVRTWNSKWPTSQAAMKVGLFGPNWRSNFEERIFIGSDGYTRYARGDGSFWSFGFSGGALAVAAPANVTASLAPGASYWTLTLQNGEKRLFNNATGSLISITDRNGNTTQLSYDGANRLVTVTDPASRHLYFAYQNGSSYLVTAVTSDFGVSLSYSYDGQNRLIQITKPDNTTISFEYDGQARITAVKDVDGKILESHTYDTAGRGLTSSRASGIDAINISY